MGRRIVTAGAHAAVMRYRHWTSSDPARACYVAEPVTNQPSIQAAMTVTEHRRRIAADSAPDYDTAMNVHRGSIGIFDSGLGGLSVARELQALLPDEHLLYVADSAYCPYGEREPAVILERSATIAGALVRLGAKAIVVACNTASAVALEALRERHPGLPLVGLVPAVKPAVAISRTRRIAVLATPRTVAGELLSRAIRDHGGGAQILPVPAPGLADLVEAGETDGARVDALLRTLLAPALVAGVDTIVLGCTHYPFLAPAIGRVAVPEVALIDSGAAIARRTAALLTARGLHATVRSRPTPPALTLLTSGDPVAVAAVASRLLGAPTQVLCAGV